MFNQNRAETLFREKRKEVFEIVFLFFLWWVLSIIICLNSFNYNFVVYVLIAVSLWALIKMFIPVKIKWLMFRREISSFQDCPKLWEAFSAFYPGKPLTTLFLAHTKKIFASNFFIGFFQKTETVVSQGVLDIVNDEELKTIIGHEIGHFKNKDPLLVALVDYFIGGMLIFSGLSVFVLSMFLAVSVFLLSRIISILILILAFLFLSKKIFDFLFSPLLMSLKAYLFQQMEYTADIFVAKEIENPRALASALVKIEKSSPKTICLSHNEKMKKKIREKFSTHPATEKRVELLMSLYDK